MTQSNFNLSVPLEWEDSDFWGKTSKCRRFSIRSQTMNGKPEHVLWWRNEDGRVIPKNMGVYESFEKAVAAAEEARYGEPPRYNKIYDWKPLWPKKK
jgi:hypothetical protein